MPWGLKWMGGKEESGEIGKFLLVGAIPEFVGLNLFQARETLVKGAGWGNGECHNLLVRAPQGFWK